MSLNHLHAWEGNIRQQPPPEKLEKKISPSDIRFRLHDITPLAKIASYREMIKVDKRNLLKEKLVINVNISVGRNCLTSPTRYFFLLKILSYTSSLPLKSAMCFSKASETGIRPWFLIESKQIWADVHTKGGYVYIVYRMEVLTVFRMFLLQLGSRVGENGRVPQTQLAGIAHWLQSQPEVTVSLG